MSDKFAGLVKFKSCFKFSNASFAFFMQSLKNQKNKFSNNLSEKEKNTL